MNALEYYRLKQKLTITQLGQRVGMHPSNISLVEKGHRKAWGNLKSKLANVLDVNEEKLFDENGNVKMMNNNSGEKDK